MQDVHEPIDHSAGVSGTLAAEAGQQGKARSQVQQQQQQQVGGRAGLQLPFQQSPVLLLEIRQVTRYSSPQQAGGQSSAVQLTWWLPLLGAPQLTVTDLQTASLPGWRAQRDQTAAVQPAWRLWLLQLWGS